jgi:glycosidase
MVVQQHQLLMRVKQLLGTACIPLVVSCANAPLASVESVELETHVDDWRDEVIYQLMTDRFANGDPSNDYRVDPSSLARYQGGDYQGIIDRLGYLEELGVTALWISPIVLNVDADAGFDAYHGYWAQNLDRLNPHFGDLAALRKLVNEAHARGIKVILDIVTNHLGQVFFYDINNNGRPDEWLSGSGVPGNGKPGGMDGESSSTDNGTLARITEYDPDYDRRGIQGFTSLGLSGLAPIRFFDMPEIWRVPPEPAIFQRAEAYNRRGRVTNWECAATRPKGTDLDICEQVVLGDFPGGLKDVNTLNPQVRAAMIDSFTRWVLETDLDGFRIDTLKHVEHDFWREFAPAVRKKLAAKGKNRFLMFGEAFVGGSEADDRLEGSYTEKDMLDSVFYFPQHHAVFGGVFRQQGATRVVETLLAWRKEHYGDKPQPGGVGVAPQNLLVNFIDNHDRPRFRFAGGEVGDRPTCADSKDGCDAALYAALTYLFTEEGIPCVYYGTEQDFDGGNDPGNREPLWTSKYKTDGETFKWIRKLTDIRKDREALRRGDTTLLWTTDHVGDEQDAGMLAFERTIKNGDYALIVINTHAKKTSQTSTDESAEGSTMQLSLPEKTKLRDLLGTSKDQTVGADGTLKVSLPPYGASIFVKAN